MRKVLVVSTHADIEHRIKKMLHDKLIPDDEYSIIVEFFEDSGKISNIFPNVFPIDDLRNREAIDAAFRKCQTWGPFHQVIATDEYAILLAAEMRERLQIDGEIRLDLLKFRDKVLMKQSLTGSSVRVPALYRPEQIIEMTAPVVVKPRSYAGAKGIRVLRSESEKKEAVSSFKGRPDSDLSGFQEFSLDDVEFEEYIDGTVFHIDGLVFEGKVIFCVGSEYYGTCLEFLSGKKLGSLSVASQSEQELWLKFSQAVNQTMRIPDGAFHLEAFKNSQGERIFLEIGVRPGGSLIVPTIERATGLNLDVAHIQCQLGIKPALPRGRVQQFAWLVFPKKFNSVVPQSVEEIITPDLNEIPGLIWSETPSVGSPYTGPFSYISNLGSFIFTSPKLDLVETGFSIISNKYAVLPRGNE